MIDQERADRNLLNACQCLESELLDDLQCLLGQPSTASTRQSLLTILDRLLINLPRHLELASQGGYLTEVQRLRPGWHRQIEALEGANIWCFSALQELHDHIAHEPPSATIETKDSGDIDIWVRSLLAIRGHETRLLQRAFTLDIGGES